MKKELIIDSIKSLEIKGIYLKEKQIRFDNKTYSKKEWFVKTGSFNYNKEKNTIFITNEFNKKWDVIYYSFLVNVFKCTKNNGILLQAVFLLFSFITFHFGLFFQNNANFGLEEILPIQLVFVYFLSIFSFVIFLILFFMFFVLKFKLFLCKKNNQIRLQLISKKEYENIASILIEKTKNNVVIFKPIYTDRLIIREFNYFDVNEVLNYASKETLYKFLIAKPINTKTEALKYIETSIQNYKNNFISKLAIVSKENNHIMGYIGLSKYDYSLTTCQIIYAIDEQYWHKGYVSEAVIALSKYLFDIGKDTIYAGHIEENINSGKVLLKSGFNRYPSKDGDLIIDGVKRHIISYILKKEVNDGEE